jgi:hypothetical protein
MAVKNRVRQARKAARKSVEARAKARFLEFKNAPPTVYRAEALPRTGPALEVKGNFQLKVAGKVAVDYRLGILKGNRVPTLKKAHLGEPAYLQLAHCMHASSNSLPVLVVCRDQACPQHQEGCCQA